MTLNPVCENVETAQGVPLTVTGVAQVKIMKNPELLHTASEQFLGKKEHEIKSTVLQTLEGHLRAILGTLTVEEVYKDRDQFASLVREVAAPDVGRMGIEVLSFTIKDVYDNVTYLQSLGKAQTAAVKRDAEIGVAQANRDAGIREAECEKAAMDVKYSTDTKIEDNSRGFNYRRQTLIAKLTRRKPRHSWRLSCRPPKSSRELEMKKFRFRLSRGGSRSRLRSRRSRGRRKS